MSSVFSLFISINFPILMVADWVVLSNSTLPVSDSMFATGSYNDTIYLIGGDLNPNQITEYDTTQQTITDFNATYFSVDISGYGQFSTQNEHILYMVHNTVELSMFNLKSMEFIPSWMSLTSDILKACLTSALNHLFVIGVGTGSEVLDLDLETHTFVDNVPSMNDSRQYHSCAVNNDYLWAIGGMSLSTVERIAITDISANAWNYAVSLPYIQFAARAISYEESIFIIGGYNNGALDTVSIINTVTNTVTTDILPYAVAAAGTIYHKDGIYLFGGDVNTIVYYDLRTDDPTVIATLDPTTAPVYEQTNNPSMFPSILIAIEAEDIETTEEETDNNDGDTQDNNTPISNDSMFGGLSESFKRTMIITLSIAIVICSGVLVLCCYQLRKYKMVRSELEIIQQQQQHHILNAGDDDMNEDEKLQIAMALSLMEENDRKREQELLDQAIMKEIMDKEIQKQKDEEKEDDAVDARDGVQDAVVSDDGFTVLNTDDVVDDYKQDVHDESDGGNRAANKGDIFTDDGDSDDDVLSGDTLAFGTDGDIGEIVEKQMDNDKDSDDDIVFGADETMGDNFGE